MKRRLHLHFSEAFGLTCCNFIVHHDTWFTFSLRLPLHPELIQVLADPPEALAVALTLEDGAHEQFERSAVQLGPWDLSLSGRLAVKAERLTKFLL
jgi:hypothetical protein